jgi:hypothetical protein
VAASGGHTLDPQYAFRFVRPFTMTGGRTRPHREIALEALVVATRRGRLRADTLAAGRRDVVALCRETLSVAEIAARLTVPLGVARVLVDDLAAQSLVCVHQPAPDDTAPDPVLLARVLRGLRQL